MFIAPECICRGLCCFILTRLVMSDHVEQGACFLALGLQLLSILSIDYSVGYSID